MRKVSKAVSLLCVLSFSVQAMPVKNFDHSMKVSRSVAQIQASEEKILQLYSKLMSPVLSSERQTMVIEDLLETVFKGSKSEKSEKLEFLSNKLRGMKLEDLIKENDIQDNLKIAYSEQVIERLSALGILLDKKLNRETLIRSSTAIGVGAVVGAILSTVATTKAFHGHNNSSEFFSLTKNITYAKQYIIIASSVAGGAAAFKLERMFSKVNNLQELKDSLREEVRETQEANRVLNNLK